MEIINLNEDVIKTLDFFIANNPPKLDLSQYEMPFVVGSGNAYNTGLILFSGKSAIFADESNFKENIESYKKIIEKGFIKDAVIISASGEKDSVWEAEYAKKYGLKTTLLTCNRESSAAKIADKVIVYQSISEPYTYNFSTYLGMILSITNESPEEIKNIINKIELPSNFASYNAYAFILPDKFLNICPMLDIKKSELFGSNISVRAFTEGHARHAKFVIPSEKELVIKINIKNNHFGNQNHQWDLTLNDVNFGTILSLTYFIIGKIQEIKPPYFKENIEAYCNDYGPKAYGKDGKFDVIVPGN